MKTKLSTGIFFVWVALFMVLLIHDASAAWYEWSKAAREKLEWDEKQADCVTRVISDSEDDISVKIAGGSIIEFSVNSSDSYKKVSGLKTLCINGSKYADCDEILGFWESWDAEGDCIPGLKQASD